MKRYILQSLFVFVSLILATTNICLAEEGVYHFPNYYIPDTVGPVHAFEVENLLWNGDFERTDYVEKDSLKNYIYWIPGLDFCDLQELPGWLLHGNNDPIYNGYICLFKHAEGAQVNRRYARCLMGMIVSDYSRLLAQKVGNIEVGATYCLDFYVRQYIQDSESGYTCDGRFQMGYAYLEEEDELMEYYGDYELLQVDGERFITNNYIDWTYMKFEFVAKSPYLGIMLSVYDFSPYTHYERGLEHIVDFDEVRLYKVADSGVIDVEDAHARAIGGNGCIHISGLPLGAEVEVVSLDGRIAYKGAGDLISIAPGCYVVRSQGWTAKVAVR